MNDKIKAVLASPSVRKAAFALVVAVLAALGVTLGSGCAPLTPAQRAKLDLFECRVAALEPSCGAVFDTAQLVRDVYAGNADLGAVFGALRLSEAEARAAVDRLNACSGDLPAGVVQ